MRARQSWLVLIAVVALSTVACASQQSTPPSAAATPVDVNKIIGKWHGWYVDTSGRSFPLQVEVGPDGTYTSRIGSASGNGTFKVEGSKILTTGHLLGPGAPFERMAVATLTEKSGRPYVTGQGKTDRGPYSFEMMKE